MERFVVTYMLMVIFIFGIATLEAKPRYGLLERLLEEMAEEHAEKNVKLAKKTTDDSGKLLFCYYTNWARYRSPPARFGVSDIDPLLCTHIMYAFLDFNSNGFVHNDQNELDELVALKTTNPSLKLIFSIGGANEPSSKFQAICSTQAARTKFAKAAVQFIRSKQFDGLDVDWEYPMAENRDYYSQLLKALREEFEREAAASGEERLELTAATAAGQWSIDPSYDMAELDRYLDYVLVMTYDLHGSWDSYIGLHSALYGKESWDTLSQEWVIQYYLSKGVRREKLVLGLPTYGRSFTLCGTGGQTVPGTPNCGAGAQGVSTKEAGFLSYQEICTRVNSGWTRRLDRTQQAVYAHQGTQWVGYDDVESIEIKVDFLKEEKLAGAMFWALDLDDFNNQCGDGNYPVIQAVKNALGGSAPPPTAAPTAATTQAPTAEPTQAQTVAPTPAPTVAPTLAPTVAPTLAPTAASTAAPTQAPTAAPTQAPTARPTQAPTAASTQAPTVAPTAAPTQAPTETSTAAPTQVPTAATTQAPTAAPTAAPTQTPTAAPTVAPTEGPGDGEDFSCPTSDGIFSDPRSCSSFYQCAHGTPYPTQCPSGTLFDSRFNFCNWDYLVSCGNNQVFTCPAEFGFYPDPTDCTKYYQCADSLPYPGQCAPGLRWNHPITACDWSYNVAC